MRAEYIMTKSEIQKFLYNRQALNISAFCRETDITTQYLGMILRGDRPLTEETARKLKPVMIKYGWSEP